MRARAFDVAVIGAGANGLVAATTLARAGLRVLLLERRDAVGGQREVVEFAAGFRAAPLGLDSGWLPPAVSRATGVAGPERARCDAPVTVAVEPGTFLTLSRDPARAADAIRVHSAPDAARWPAFVDRLRKLAGFLEALYQTPAPAIDVSRSSEWRTLLGLGRRFRALGRHGMIDFLRTLPMSVAELLEDWFEFGPLQAAVAAGAVQDLPHGPRSGGTGFVLLHHLAGAPAGSVRGRLPWRAGPGAFVTAAEQAARRSGVAIRTGAAVSGVVVRDDAVAGVTLSGGEEIATPAVLSTADPSRTLLEWVDPVWLDPDFLHAVGSIRYRGCTAIVLYALDGLPEFPGLESREALGGVVTLTPALTQLERAADAAKYGTVSEHPHVEISAPSVRWPELAPEGKAVLVARAQYAPHRLREGAVWDPGRREALADAVTDAIACVSPGFAHKILHRIAWSPLDLEARYGLREGAASQGELALDQILYMRPVPGYGGHAMPIAGLFLGGAGTHPGPGILGGPGWLAARSLIRARSGASRASESRPR